MSPVVDVTGYSLAMTRRVNLMRQDSPPRHRLRRLKAVAALAAATTLLGACAGLNGNSPHQPIIVNSGADDNSAGTLRWAISRSNAFPGRYRIVLTPDASGTLVIKPTSALPTIRGPARIEGPWTGSGTPTVALDG